MSTRRNQGGTQLPTPQSQSEKASKTAKMATDASASLPIDLQNLRSVLVADMKDMIKSLIESALSPLKESLDAVQSTTLDHGRRIADLESALSECSDTVANMEKTCDRLSAENAVLVNRAEDIENRSRRCNVRVVNIPENAEGTDTVKFMTEFFAEVVGKDVYQTPPVLDRAHRLGQERPGPTGKPRVMIVRFHYYQDKVRALRSDRNRLNWRGQKVLFFPDYGTSTAKQRASFARVKSLLYERKVKFRLAYPALLKVDFEGETHDFKTASEAQRFYDRHFAGADGGTE